MEGTYQEQLAVSEDVHTRAEDIEVVRKISMLTKIEKVLLVSTVSLSLLTACTESTPYAQATPTAQPLHSTTLLLSTQTLEEMLNSVTEESELPTPQITRHYEIEEEKVSTKYSANKLKHNNQEINWTIAENQEIMEILNLLSDIEINQNSELTYQGYSLKKEGMILDTTDSSLTSIDFFVVHYDSSTGERSGVPLTADYLVSYFNRHPGKGTQFVIDTYPVDGSATKGEGHGVLQISDMNRFLNHAGYTASDAQKTADLIPKDKETGDVSDYTKQVKNRGVKFNLNEYALGVEMIGNDFSEDFPNNMPPPQETANLLSLLRAVSKEYDLKAWDIVGHNEVQNGKPDPGDEYMLTVRYMLGIMYTNNPESFGVNFLSGATIEEYFKDLREYAIAKIGEDRFNRWNDIYKMDTLLLPKLAEEDNIR